MNKPLPSSKKPNIVFFFTDDQRFDTIRALGNTEVYTPNIDMLVQQGTAFTQAHIPCGTSGAVCMPSRAMLHSGRTLFHLQQEGQNIPPEHTTPGETLQQVGYETFGTGKWHNGTASYARSFTCGGEIFFGGMFDHWNVPANHFDPSGLYEQRASYILNPFASRTVTKFACDHVSPGKHSSELFGEFTAQWLSSYNEKKPYFAYVSFMAPHDPRSMPEQFLKMYDPQKITLPPNFMAEHPFDFGIHNVRDEILSPYPRSHEEVRIHLAEYYGIISHLDCEIGKIIQAVKQRGEFDETLFIFAGDNGLALRQHGLFGKQNHYEHSIRVPLIFAGPGIPQNRQCEAYAYLLDIYPTICSYLGVGAPDSVEGVDLLPLIRETSKSERDNLYFAYTDSIRSVKDQRYKLIEYATEQCRYTQLFDLKEDPWELCNLYEKSIYTDKVEELRQLLYTFCDSWEDRKHPMGKVFWERYETE